MRTAQLSRGVTLAALVALFFVATALNTRFATGLRLDLTENKLYTVSEGMSNLLAGLEDPINLYLFFSEKSSRNEPSVRNYHRLVLDLLEEYRLLSDGKLVIHQVDPEPFSEDEDRATQLGLQAVRTAEGDSLYLGIAGTNALGEVEKIPFLQPGKEQLLEYELGQLIYALSRTDKLVVGLMTSLDMMQIRVSAETGRVNEAWAITEQLEQLFDVRPVLTAATVIDPEIDVLLVVHPLDLSKATQYAIDQYILSGGKGFFFVDPYANEQHVPQVQGQPPPGAHDRSSNLNSLFRAWGFEVDERNAVGDRAYALRVGLGEGRSAVHLAMLGVRADGISADDVATQGLESINFAIASHVRLTEGSEAVLTPLVQTSKQAGLIPLERFRFIASPDVLEQGFTPTGESYALAARVRGKFKSAFAEPPEGASDKEPHITESAEEVNVVVVGDADMLPDRMWAQVRSFFGQNIIQAFASNRDFAVNIVGNLAGSDDLIGIKSRSGFTRPFTRVLDIETAAARKYKDTEQSLNEELQRVEQRLSELQKRRSDADAKSLLTPAQQEEIKRFRIQQVETRKKLRRVRHQLTADIDQLGAFLKAVNIGAVPSAVVVFALILGFFRVRRRSRAVS